MTAEPLTLFAAEALPQQPLTCEFCRHAPVGCALVNDLATGRVTHLVCEPCGVRSLPLARRISKSGASAWLFTLVPAIEKGGGRGHG